MAQVQWQGLPVVTAGLRAMNQAVTRLYAYEDDEPGTGGDADAVAWPARLHGPWP